jgi:hypothetical protein
MRRIRWSAAASAAVVVAAASALAGCQDRSPPRPPEPAPKARPNAPGAPAFTEITAACPATPGGLPVVKIQITDVSPKKLGHVTALFQGNADGTASTEEKLQDLPEVVFKSENPTRLDVDTRTFLKKPGDVALVEVELVDAAASFAPVPAAITAGNDAGVAMFCIKDKDHRINPKPTDRTARFYVQYVDSKAPLYGKFNIFLLLRDGPYLTPVVLDPKIHNGA